MKNIGLDIGTTTISAVMLENGHFSGSITVANDSKISDGSFRMQDPDRIYELCVSVLNDLGVNDADSISLTGQMHGIVYIDKYGRSCGPAVSWQDQRGNDLYCENETYSSALGRITGYKLSTGFGTVTLFHDTVNGILPTNTRYICTIPDYIAMRLAETEEPVLHPSMAQSIGCFDMLTGLFDLKKLAEAGIDITLFPQVNDRVISIGQYSGGPLIFTAIGDNQASVYGACRGRSKLLANIGTGSQISMISDEYRELSGLETRPYLDGEFLISGNSLCGGSSFDILTGLVNEVIDLFVSVPQEQLLKILDELALKSGKDKDLKVDTRFRGTREEPEIRGSITGITNENFTLGKLSYAFADGVCRELYDFYTLMPDADSLTAMSVSGNAVRNSELYRKCLSQYFKEKEIMMSEYREEAAYGAALYAFEKENTF